MPECEFPQFNPSNDEIAEILRTTKVIAVVGLSPKPNVPSHSVSAYMQDVGYKIIPVNPGRRKSWERRCTKACWRSLVRWIW
jgi:predicted CoA-binding protein